VNAKAKFNNIGRDLYWRFYDMDDGSIQWGGYDDEYWWNNVAVSDQFRKRVGAKSGRVYILNAGNDQVTIEAPQASDAGESK
jgi:hypothetical protein